MEKWLEALIIIMRKQVGVGKVDKKKYPTLYNVDDIQAIFNMNKSTGI